MPGYSGPPWERPETLEKIVAATHHTVASNLEVDPPGTPTCAFFCARFGSRHLRKFIIYQSPFRPCRFVAEHYQNHLQPTQNLYLFRTPQRYI